jgi:hypothetical protein
MRRNLSVFAAAALVLTPVAAEAQSTFAALTLVNNSLFWACGTKCITGPVLNSWNQQILASMGLLAGNNSWSGSNVFSGSLYFATGTGYVYANGLGAVTYTTTPTAPIAANSIVGNNTGSSGGPFALTYAQVAAALPTFTTSAPGTVPASGGSSTALFLNQAGTFTAAGASAPYTDAVAVCSVDNTGATDTTTALNACLTAYPAVGLRAGTYKTSACVNVPSTHSLVGSGYGSTTITSTSATANGVCLADYGSNILLRDLTVTKSVTATGGCGITTGANSIGLSVIENVNSTGNYAGFCLGPTDDSQCSFCIAQQNYSTGFSFTNTASSQTLQWSLRQTLSQKNAGWGYYVNAVTGATTTIIGSPWISPQSYSNTAGGFGFVATGAAVINDITITNPIASYDGGDEFVFATNSGNYANITGGLIEGAGYAVTGVTHTTPASGVGCGVHVAIGPLAALSIQGTTIITNSYDGICVDSNSGAINVNVTGAQIGQNGQHTGNTYNGFTNTDASAIVSLIGNAIGPNYAAQQKYGVYSSGGTVMMFGNSVSNNATGQCQGTFKPAGGAAAYNVGTSCP